MALQGVYYFNYGQFLFVRALRRRRHTALRYEKSGGTRTENDSNKELRIKRNGVCARDGGATLRGFHHDVESEIHDIHFRVVDSRY
jgi:hypothetical protein